MWTRFCVMGGQGLVTKLKFLYFYNHGNMNEDQVIQALSALAQGTRLRAYRALVVAGLDGMAAGDLAAALDMPASTLTFHLKALQHAGWVSQERRGRFLIYRAKLSTMDSLTAFLMDDCCGGQDCRSAAPVLALSRRASS